MSEEVKKAIEERERQTRGEPETKKSKKEEKAEEPKGEPEGSA
jgi:hypothetical protein